MRRLGRARVMTIAAASLMALGSPQGALAQDDALTLLLTCQGIDKTYRKVGTSIQAPSLAQREHAKAAGLAPPGVKTADEFAYVDVPARISVAIRGGVIRLKPSAETAPGWTQRRSADGWYELSDVAITDIQVRGKAAWGGLSGKHRLDIDRRTGDARFGNFRGVCEKSSDDPDARKF